MKKSQHLFCVVCLLAVAALLLTSCAHPWRLASNPFTPIPTLDIDINASQEPATDEITPDTEEPSEEPTEEPSEEPTEEPSEEPSNEATDNPDASATPNGEDVTDEPDTTNNTTVEPNTETPTGGNGNNNTPKPTATPKPTSTPKPTATPKPTNTPKPTPEPDIKPFSTKAINNSNTYDNSMFGKAKVTMINIWSTTCGPCIQELPHIQELANNYKSRGVNIVTALGDSEQSGAIQTALNIIGGISGFNLPVLRNNASFNAQFPAGAYPTTYFIDQNGNILKVVTTSNSYEKWCKILDDLLK